MTADADHPADVREVIKNWLDEPPSTCDCDECVTSFLAALSAAGRVVVPVEDLRAVLERRVHCHSRPGTWDDDNRPGVAGTPCRECAARERLAATLGGATPADVEVVLAAGEPSVEEGIRRNADGSWSLIERLVYPGPWLPVDPAATPAAGTSGAPSPGSP